MNEKQNEHALQFIDFIRYGWKHRKWIIIFAFVCALVVAGIMLMKKNTYRSYGAFFPSSSVISGRVNLYREMNQEWVDIFGEENEADRAFVIGNTSNTLSKLIERFKIYEHYGIDVKKDPDGMRKVYKKFTKRFKFSRSGYKHLEVTFEDEDKNLAADVVNAAMEETEKSLKEIYIRAHNEMARALLAREDSIQLTINTLTDSLVKLRTTYGIYDLISPGRKSIINGKMQGSGAAYARGIEDIQVLEEVKDRMTIEKGKYEALANEFKGTLYYDIPLIHVVQWAAPAGEKAGPFRTLSVIATFAISAFFAWILLVLFAFWDKNKSYYLGNESPNN